MPICANIYKSSLLNYTWLDYIHYPILLRYYGNPSWKTMLLLSLPLLIILKYVKEDLCILVDKNFNPDRAESKFIIKSLNSFLLIDSTLAVNSFHKLAQPRTSLEHTTSPWSFLHCINATYCFPLIEKFISIRIYFSTLKKYKHKYFHLPWFILINTGWSLLTK